MRKSFLIWTLGLISTTGLHAQASPYVWSFTVKKISDRTFELHCTISVSHPWHIYSQFTPDGGPLPTKLEFAKNPLYVLVGPVKENGNMLTKHEAVFDIDVKYFNDKVDFVQAIKMKGNAKTNLTGSVTFMVCNDEQCLPPTTQKFSVALN